MVNPSIAWVLSALAISHALQLKPLPDGVSTAKAGEWNLTINIGPGSADGLEPFDIRGDHDRFVAFVSMGPAEGMFGGYSEDEFIEDMKRFVPRADWEPMLADKGELANG